MNIIIPMAGRGSRLRPHTLTTPKPLISFVGKSIVQRLTTLKDGPSLDRFMVEYRPEYELLTQILDIELYLYIQAAAKDFLQKRGM